LKTSSSVSPKRSGSAWCNGWKRLFTTCWSMC
jgi:hypothetical protein